MKDCSHCGKPFKELIACPCGGPACRSCHDACKREFDDGLESYNPDNNGNYIHEKDKDAQQNLLRYPEGRR